MQDKNKEVTLRECFDYLNRSLQEVTLNRFEDEDIEDFEAKQRHVQICLDAMLRIHGQANRLAKSLMDGHYL